MLMKKLTRSLLFLLPLATTPYIHAQEEEISASGDVHFQQASELTQGLTFQGGGFVATHQLENNSGPTTTSFGYPDDSHLPPSAPLLDAYNAAMAAGGETAPWYAGGGLDYFMGLNPLEQASLYKALGEDAFVQHPSGFNLLEVLREWNALGPMLAALPSGEAGSALNSLDYFNTEDFTGVDLTGWDTEGLNLQYIDFSGSNVTPQQLNAAAEISNSNLSGLDLSELNTTGKNLLGINFTGSNITAEQLNAASNIEGTNLSGLQNLTDLNTTDRNLAGINFTGSNITAEQLNASTTYTNSNLSGLDLTGLNTSGKWLAGVNLSGSTVTGEQLNAVQGAWGIASSNLSGLDLTGLNTVGRELYEVNLSNSNITIEQLVASNGIWRANLSGTLITRAGLEAALIAANKNPNAYPNDLNYVTFD
jgi:uncharacterized protein YjbI with pentapeptide repeats